MPYMKPCQRVMLARFFFVAARRVFKGTAASIDIFAHALMLADGVMKA